MRFPLSEISTGSNSSETQAFCGFEETQIRKFSKINRDKLDILQWELGDSASFWGFEALDIRKYERIKNVELTSSQDQ